MATVLFMRRGLTGLVATDALGIEALSAVPLNEDVRVEITRPRNLKHMRKFFALLNAIFPHQNVYPTLETFRAAIEVALGYGETVKLPDGRTIIVPKSISFAKLDQEGFDQLFERAVDLICTRILPGLDREDLSREVGEILAGRSGVPGYAMERAG